MAKHLRFENNFPCHQCGSTAWEVERVTDEMGTQEMYSRVCDRCNPYWQDRRGYKATLERMTKQLSGSGSVGN